MLALLPLKVWEQFVDEFLSILKHTHLKNFFNYIRNLSQSIKFTTEEEGMENQHFLKRDSGKISVLVQRKPTHTD